MSQHPAFAAAKHSESSRSTSEDNPFYTPAERSEALLGNDADITDVERGPYDPHHHVELDHEDPAHRRSSSSVRASGDRPLTPMVPMEMMGYGARSNVPSQVDRRDFGQQSIQTSNPFSSPDDREDEDVISPILPSRRSPVQRSPPMVHYPSWSEVSEFDFQGDGRRGHRNTNSIDSVGGDAWHSSQERRDGRHEMA